MDRYGCVDTGLSSMVTDEGSDGEGRYGYIKTGMGGSVGAGRGWVVAWADMYKGVGSG